MKMIFSGTSYYLHLDDSVCEIIGDNGLVVSYTDLEPGEAAEIATMLSKVAEELCSDFDADFTYEFALENGNEISVSAANGGELLVCISTHEYADCMVYIDAVLSCGNANNVV